MKSSRRTNGNMTAVIIAYFLIYVVWGSTYYFIGVTLKDIPPFLLGALRFSTAGLILLCLCLLRREAVFTKELIRRSAISGIVLLFIDMAVIMLAQRYLNSSFVAIIASSTAIWIMVFDIPMWRKNFRSPFTITGILIGFGGVAMLYVEQIGTRGAFSNSGRGILLLIFGCISWALGTLYTKYRFPRTKQAYGFAGSAWQMLFAGTMFWICSFLNKEISHVCVTDISSTAWFSLSYLILFGSLLAYSAYIWLLRHRPATEVGTHAYVNPFVAVALGFFPGGEQITILQVSGLLVILFGVMLVSCKRQQK